MAMDVKTKLSAARYVAMNKVPYLAAGIYKLVFRPVPLGTISKVGTMMMTDKGVVLYEPECVQRWNEAQCASVIVHELMHLLRKHGKRCGDRDPRKWNKSADREINDDLAKMRLPLPDGGGLQPEQIGQKVGLAAEEYYPHEHDNENDSPNGNQGVGLGDCGTCSHAGGGEGEDGESEAEKEHGGISRSEIEMDNMRKQVADAVQKEAAKGRGTVPAGLERWAKQHLLKPKIPWQKKLGRLVRTAIDHRPGAVDYRYSRFSKRQAGLVVLEDEWDEGIPVLPGLDEPVPHVGIGIDTSGSMGEAEILRAASEANGIMKAAGARVQFIACDAAVHAAQTVDSIEELVKLIKGGGGTDFHPVFEAVEKLKPKPEVFVFITDGGGPAPESPPAGVHVIWLLVGPYRCRPYARGGHVTWGSWLEVDDDGKNVLDEEPEVIDPGDDGDL